jgi:hypothetical protein
METGSTARVEPEYITPKEAIKHFVSSPGPHCVRQWMRKGVIDWSSPKDARRRVKLKYIRDGSLLYTTVPWINDFKAACNSIHQHV